MLSNKIHQLEKTSQQIAYIFQMINLSGDFNKEKPQDNLATLKIAQIEIDTNNKKIQINYENKQKNNNTNINEQEIQYEHSGGTLESDIRVTGSGLK